MNTALTPRTLVIAFGLILTACGTAPVQQHSHQPDTQAEPSSTRIADKSFTSDTLYALLVAEFAMARERQDIALGNYVQQAITTRDPSIAEHATHLARMFRSAEDSLAMAELWSQLEPENQDARSLYASSLVQSQRYDEAFEQARLLIEAGESAAFENLAANVAEGPKEEALALARKFEALLKSHPNNTSLLVGYSLLLEGQNQLKQSLNAVHRALKLDKNNVAALYQESRLLQAMGDNKQAMEKMGALVEQNPANHRLRLRYARALVDVDLSEALTQYEILNKQLPYDHDVLFMLALVERELKVYDKSAEHFLTLIARQQHLNPAHYQLAKIYEAQQRPDKALPHYQSINAGENLIPALTNATRILLEQQKADEALALLRSKRPTNNPEIEERLYTLEADILSQTGNTSAAEKVLSAGVEQNPNSTALLYARAMLYTRIDYIAAAERDLKQVLALKPNNAATLNALGYTLADKTERLDEAQTYIARALELAPDDPAIMDSMGWLLFRKGKAEEALVMLRKALAALPDHEIAAHLGEVLWVSGMYDEAQSVWREGLELKPDSQIIHQTLHRLNATLQ